MEVEKVRQTVEIKTDKWSERRKEVEGMRHRGKGIGIGE